MNFFLLKEWLTYYHLKTDEHSLHSPFFYQFYKNFLQLASPGDDFNEIERNRQLLLKNEEIINLNDLGAGSKAMKSSKRKVKNIARHSLSSAKFSRLLYQLIKHFKFKEIVELGTCLGINTAYLAKADPKANIYTFEGDQNLINIAKENLNKGENVQILQGNIDYTLKEFLSEREKSVDLAYIDANHTYAATIDYFQQLLPFHNRNSIYIFDDIHWSREMKKAWNEIKHSPAVTSSIDIFDAGIIFFNPDFQKQHFILDF